MSKFIVKDSGQRQEFGTGARRDIQAGKGRFDLIPTLPMRRLARLYEEGAKKYGDDNYRKGIPLRRYLDSAERHLNMLKAGEIEEDHGASVVWNIFSYLWTLNEIEAGRLPKELDDRPPPEPEFAATPETDDWKARVLKFAETQGKVSVDAVCIAVFGKTSDNDKKLVISVLHNNGYKRSRSDGTWFWSKVGAK